MLITSSPNAMTFAGPMSAFKGSRSTVLPASKKCRGASTCVPVCEPNVIVERLELFPRLSSECGSIRTSGFPGYTTLPFATHMSGWFYLIGIIPLNLLFLRYVWRLYRNYSDALSRRTFGYSIQYLALLFALLLIDHYALAIRQGLQSAFY